MIMYPRARLQRKTLCFRNEILYSLTVRFGRGRGGRSRIRAIAPVVWRDGAAGPAVAPLALAADVRAAGVDEGGAPGLVLGQVGLVPRALAVDHAVELEGEDARLPLRRAGHRHAYPLCKRREVIDYNEYGEAYAHAAH